MNGAAVPAKTRLCLVMAGAVFLLARPASAHEKWFLDAHGYGLRWDLFFRPLPLAFVFSVLLVTFLHVYPLNFTSAFGIPFPDTLFILCAGSVELGIGLWLLLGIFPREIILIAWIPTNLTLTVFNWTELIGHLPIYGVLAVLLLWSPGAENRRLWLRGLREGPLAILHPKE